MPDAHVPPIALAFSGLVLALKPDSITTAIAFIAAAGLFAFTKWLEQQEFKKTNEVEAQLKDLKGKVEMLIIQRGLNR